MEVALAKRGALVVSMGALVKGRERRCALWAPAPEGLVRDGRLCRDVMAYVLGSSPGQVGGGRAELPRVRLLVPVDEDGTFLELSVYAGDVYDPRTGERRWLAWALPCAAGA